MPGGEAAEEDAAEDRGAKSEEQDLEIEVRVGFVRDADLVSGHEAHYPAEKRYGEQSAEKAAHQRERKAFDQELAKDAGSGSALRGAYGDFFLARRAPSEKQVRDIDAGDEEDEADSAHHKPEAQAGLLGKEVVLEGLDCHREIGVCFWVALRELFGDDGHF